MRAQSDKGSEAWRRRHTYSSSLLGRVEILAKSRYAERGLIPGTAEGEFVILLPEIVDWAEGPGGLGCCRFAFVVDDNVDGINASFRRCSEIFS